MADAKELEILMNSMIVKMWWKVEVGSDTEKRVKGQVRIVGLLDAGTRSADDGGED